MGQLIQRRKVASLLRAVRLSQPSRTSDEAYAQMVRFASTEAVKEVANLSVQTYAPIFKKLAE